MRTRTLLWLLHDALARIARASEYIDDGEIDEAVRVLLDLERELEAALLREHAA